MAVHDVNCMAIFYGAWLACGTTHLLGGQGCMQLVTLPGHGVLPRHQPRSITLLRPWLMHPCSDEQPNNTDGQPAQKVNRWEGSWKKACCAAHSSRVPQRQQAFILGFRSAQVSSYASCDTHLL